MGQSSKIKICVLFGPPASGKSEIAVEYVYANKHDYTITWLINAGNEVVTDFGISKHFDLDVSHDTKEDRWYNSERSIHAAEE